MSKRHILAASAALTALTLPALADPSNAGLEQITVTAQKRTEKAQSIPVTITALDKRALKNAHLVETEDLSAFVPNLQIGTPSGRGNQPLINIRGVGLNDFNTNNAGPNGVYVDEVYAASPAAQTFQIFDLDRVEVLKGPQGTLYGRNATGGAINYISTKPSDDFHFYQDVTYGSWNTYGIQSAINGQIAPGLDGRLAFSHNYSDGFVTNVLNGKHTNGANDYGWRLSLKYTPSDDLTLSGSFHGGIVNRRPDEYRDIGALAPFPGGIPLFGSPQCANAAILKGQCQDAYGYNGYKAGWYKGAYNRDQNLWITSYGGNIRADYHLGDITLTSISAIETDHKLHPEDSDANPYNLLAINYGARSTDITQELRPPRRRVLSLADRAVFPRRTSTPEPVHRPVRGSRPGHRHSRPRKHHRGVGKIPAS